ncbi:MAG: 4-(cytidine 5'-diphospho)-2-C-methyl-D-erythritol kinase [Muribaculaceae bacterium]|nr:4-(cytidine 5'-diphospho)-2-C-methyl-D-erythritol kinase [Muribaculaceae bacterium]
MITFPNAKINLGLNIVERRPDGYHNIETVFYPIPLTDVLEIVPAVNGVTSLTCYGNSVDCPVEKNLVFKSYKLLQDQYDLPPVAMHLYKHIPDGAGLGGGSSDAAHALKMLNQMFGLRIGDADLAAMAAKLGADCAFFIYNRPMMATGIGDRLSPVDIDLAGKTLLLVKPPVGVDTRTAYSRVVPQQPAAALLDTIARPVASWDGLLVNDFEPSVFAALPQLWLIKARLLDAGAQYAAMSGSGSTVFGIFDSDKLAEPLADTFADCVTFVLHL